MEQMMYSLLRGHLYKTKELTEKSILLCDQSETSMDDVIKLHIAMEFNLDNLNTSFRDYSSKVKEVDPDFVELCINSISKAEDSLISLKTLREVHKNKKEEPHSSIKLPTLKLPNFKGDIIDFSEFWDRFESAIGTKDLRDVEKLAYLFNCLEGPALDIIKGLPITNENYIVALEILKNRYGSKTKIIDAHYETLSKLKMSTAATTDCRSTLNTIQRHLRVLNSLGENTEGNHIRSMLRGKFPEKVLYELNVLKGTDCTSREIIEGLDRIIAAMESANTNDSIKDNVSSSKYSTEALHVQVSKKKPWSRNTERKRPSTFVAENKNIKRKRKNCIFCSGSHYNDSCNNIKTVGERKGKLGRNCYLCFTEGHFAKNCKKLIKCYHCKGPHNSALCLKKYDNQHDSNSEGSEPRRKE